MKWLAIVCLGLLALGCEGTITAEFDGEPVGTPWVGSGGPQDARSVAQGAELYALYCETCHGPQGTGAASWSGSIQGWEPIHPIVANGRGTMAAVPITNAETQLIQDYLLSFGRPDWSALSGVEVYATGCASCHGASAEGTSLGPPIRFRDAAYFRQVTNSGGWADRFESPMVGYGDRVTRAQLDEMTAWIDTFPNATTGEGLYEQFCANCHGGSSIRGRVENVDEPIAGVSREGKEDSASNRSYMPGWSTSEITDAELQLIQDFTN